MILDSLWLPGVSQNDVFSFVLRSICLIFAYFLDSNGRILIYDKLLFSQGFLFYGYGNNLSCILRKVYLSCRLRVEQQRRSRLLKEVIL